MANPPNNNHCSPTPHQHTVIYSYHLHLAAGCHAQRCHQLEGGGSGCVMILEYC
jgi:hypothetical protein